MDAALELQIDELADLWFEDYEPVDETLVYEIMHGADVDELRRILVTHEDSDYRAVAAATLGVFWSTEALPELYQALDDCEDLVSEFAHWAVKLLDEQGYHIWCFLRAIAAYADWYMKTHSYQPTLF